MIDMRVIRFKSKSGERLGVWIENNIVDITEVKGKRFGSFLDLASEAESEELGKFIEEMVARNLNDLPRYSLEEVKLLKPIEPPEVWGCGVTYKRSEEEREKETGIKGIYRMVYSAKRPEIFFKATAHRCVGPDDEIGIRGDSEWNVPEPELAFVLGPKREIIGFTGGNDVSSRDIEGTNPLYLPQAKIFEACCAIGPSIVTVDEVGSEPKLNIRCRIYRSGEVMFEGETNTGNMRRSLEELRSYLCKYNPVPPGSVCLTGTGIVPPEDFTLKEGDLVEIEIEKIGILKNRVKLLKD